MPTFNLNTVFLLLGMVVTILSETAPGTRMSYDLMPSPRNRSRSHLHGRQPPQSGTKRPKNIQNREGGSRLLAKRKPKNGRKRLDKSSLLGLMGDDFKEPWMTYNEPKKPIISIPQDEIRNLTAIRGSWATTELQFDLARLNLTADLQRFAPELLPQEDLVRQFLMKRTSCPVEFTWKDMGKQYWPRWVRQGECLNRDGFCSFPPGMICVPGVSTVVYLLHWECSKGVDRASRSPDYDDEFSIEYKKPAVPQRDRKGKTEKLDVLNPPRMQTSVLYRKKVPRLPTPIHLPRTKKRCEWKKVPYLITIDCFCAC